MLLSVSNFSQILVRDISLHICKRYFIIDVALYEKCGALLKFGKVSIRHRNYTYTNLKLLCYFD